MINKLILKTLALSARWQRNLLLALADCVSILISFLVFFWLVFNSKNFELFTSNISYVFISAITAVIIFSLTGQYKGLTRYLASSELYRIALRNLILLPFIYLYSLFLFEESLSLKYLLLLFLLFTTSIGTLRFSIRDLLQNLITKKKDSRTNIAIYGAGSAGAQLASSILLDRQYNIVLFIDDNPSLWNSYVKGIVIKSPKVLENNKYDIDQVFLAMPSIPNHIRKEIIKDAESKNITILQVPSLDDIISGKSKINALKSITIDDILGRNIVYPDKRLLKNGIYDFIICITGAGGSIGSELSRQILKLQPKKILLIENCELNLYSIYNEILEKNFDDVEILPILGSTTNRGFMKSIFNQHNIDIIFHAAAYKHVPLVESNPLQGIYNNVFSTKLLCELALENNIKKFILISTDKAVRPTNVMGASKRLAELIVQSYSQKSKNNNNSKSQPILSMVRFGNVLGSSGSVIPLFHKQIKNGGPITITHPDIIRYFMTIPEAAQLVIQSASMARGGEVFLLDMGKPVKIIDLAKKMIKLSGLTLQDNLNPKGDIEIQFTGLRPGEKLYEELLIDNKSYSTEHPLIFRADEEFLNSTLLFDTLVKMEYSINQQERDLTLDYLSNLVPEWYRK